MSGSADTPKLRNSFCSLSVIVYALYILSALLGVTGIIGVMIAYECRRDAAGTLYASHFTNAIRIFWVSLALMLCSAALGALLYSYRGHFDDFSSLQVCLIWAALFLCAAMFIRLLRKVIRGLVLVFEDRPYPL